MLDDQRYILEQILSLLDSTPVDGVLPVSYTHLDVYKRQGLQTSPPWVDHGGSMRKRESGDRAPTCP